MLFKKTCAFIIFCLMLFSFALNGEAQNKKLRIAYIEGGVYTDYSKILNATIQELEKIGMIDNGTYFNSVHDTFSSKDVWAWAAKNATGNRIEFVEDAFYTANWDSIKLATQIHELNRRKDIDLVFAFGTTAGQQAVKNLKNKNIMNFSTTDPITSGISLSAEDSGNDYVHAKIEPDRYLKQLALFYNIFNFETLGICYEDSDRERGQIGYSEIIEASKEHNFTLLEDTFPPYENDTEKYINDRIACHERISKKADAVYLTIIAIDSDSAHERMDELLAPFVVEQIPTFSQIGSSEVELGALLSMATTNFNDMGAFEANVVKQIYENKKPREINQIYEGHTSLALNLRMAIEIGLALPFELLAAVDEIYK